ncbi:oligopeptide/dipeptide ABC transporter ATP-binding protein, partial [Pseudomonas sp. 2995-3]|uniref:oligopeptide/dipeptide ABC transporter ATP-binding protein n=1 Tax=Pseudomonas sp. 2995-3 TaxID=1712680 RepID=UPI0034CF9A22
IKSLPKIHQRDKRLYSIPGNVPKPGSIKQGCRFAARCSEVFDQCYEQDPALLEINEGHNCRCFLYEKEGEVINV